MIRSMFTAINALFVHSQYMDVVADNLANVNTPGFKASYMSFKDQFAQTLRTGAAPTDTLGGINPIQVGLGSVMGTVSPTFTQGALQSTGRGLDIAIQGDGFFVYESGAFGQVYSRDGNLLMDSEGYLVNASTGMRVQGWQADLNTQRLDTGQPVTGIRIPIDSSVALQTSEVVLTGNLSAEANRNRPAWNPGPPPTILPGYAALGNFSVTFGVYDSLGKMKNVTLTFVRSSAPDTPNPGDPGGVDYQGNPAGGGGLDVNGPLYWTVHWIQDPTVTPNDYNFWTANPPLQVQTGDAAHSPIGGVLFDNYGQINYTSQRVVLTGVTGSDGTVPWDITIDLSGLTMLNTGYTVAASSQNGLPGGSLNGFNVSDTDGTIYGVYSNGSQRVLGQFALATFNNPAGLFRQGNNTYSVGLNSGLPRIGPAGSGDKGTVASGYVEGSNTDMSREFAAMIMAQRGFQASTRIINTADQMLQELVNLRR